MANRVPGVFNFSANFEALIAAPLDARGTVVNYSELTDSSLPYPYLGMVVAVTSDSTPSNNGLYLLTATPATVSGNWYKLGSGTGTGVTITGVTYSGTVQTIGLSDGGSFITDINHTQLTDVQYSEGLSTHGYQYIDDMSFTGTTISGQTYHIVDLVGTAKLNIVVLDVISGDPFDHLVNLPTLAVNEAGVLFRIIAKQANLSSLNRFVLVFSEINRIIAPSIKTEYNGSYFAPLETMESIELIWDGYDWLVTNINKQPYVALNAENFVDMNANPLYTTNYLERDINNLL
jgi:hypothetical protein